MQNTAKIYADLLGGTFDKDNMIVKGEGINSDVKLNSLPSLS